MGRWQIIKKEPLSAKEIADKGSILIAGIEKLLQFPRFNGVYRRLFFFYYFLFYYFPCYYFYLKELNTLEQ